MKIQLINPNTYELKIVEVKRSDICYVYCAFSKCRISLKNYSKEFYISQNIFNKFIKNLHKTTTSFGYVFYTNIFNIENIIKADDNFNIKFRDRKILFGNINLVEINKIKNIIRKNRIKLLLNK